VGDSEVDEGAALGKGGCFLFVTVGTALGKGGCLLHDAEEIVLKVVPESRGVLALFLHAVSIEETGGFAPTVTFDGTTGVDAGFMPYVVGFSRRRSFIWVVLLAHSSSLKPAKNNAVFTLNLPGAAVIMSV
jgi:hypothetical protein